METLLRLAQRKERILLLVEINLLLVIFFEILSNLHAKHFLNMLLYEIFAILIDE